MMVGRKLESELQEREKEKWREAGGKIYGDWTRAGVKVKMR